ncbi:precorrin-3B synthase [Halocynthiibacter styelae]|uniref:Precorrin-3B synthase n=1 Tax=Halocynthiibacter styelae TaxID=2761955 RepID=A0A8J7II43_9RHOB|nr:precorrin-3B synthase [Paenihalocynthiibacter styelae]MBI1492773.1 precorrin-3B synthase [Paenihalocynthiibacter styelae]
MSAPDPIIQGWCPGALRPMMSGDGLVVRVRAVCGQLDDAQMAAIADLSDRFGNGILDVTQRANLQIRGVTAEDHPALIDGLRGLGVIDADVSVETKRNIAITPFGGDAPRDLARDLTAALSDFPDLPGKFGFAIDTGPEAVLGDVSADIRVELNEAGQMILRADHCFTGAITSCETVIKDMIVLAEWFAAHGVENGRGRMHKLLARQPDILPKPFRGNEMPRPQQVIPAAGTIEGGTLIACAYGQITSGDLRVLSALVPGVIMTPWRAFFAPGQAVTLPAASDGLITDPNDARLRIAACPGAPKCPQALGKTRLLADQIAPALPGNKSLHITGCAKGCAASGRYDVTLTATTAGFDLHHDINTSPLAQLTSAQIAADPKFIFQGPSK